VGWGGGAKGWDPPRGACDEDRGGARPGDEEGRGRREREGKGMGKLTFGDPNSGDLDSKPYGTTGERDRWKREREVTAREKSNETNGSGGGRGRAHGEGRGR
jgi:hypothetical protein